jgi:RNA polymerase II transcription elongation factor
MAVQHSPALPPMRPGLIDPSRQAEYPILLGKSLLESWHNADHQLLNVRYNWKSKQIPQRQVITENRASSKSYRLAVREGTSEPYTYSGTVDPKTVDPNSSDLALIFDKEKSVFVLESICKSLNFNLTSATTKPNIEQLHQLETIKSSTKNVDSRQDDPDVQDSDDDAADAGNPYDYRNFLADARKDVIAGNATPKPVTTGLASPIPGASRVLAASKSTTSLQSPFMGPSATKRRKVEPKTTTRDVKKTNHTVSSNATKAKPRTNNTGTRGKKGQKSAAKITASDDEMEETQSTRGKGEHLRYTSTAQKYARSPQIIVDEASDLTIDMGSPPLKAKVKHRINPDAFSSQSGAHSRTNSASVSPQSNNPPDDSEGDAEGDVDMDEDNGNEDGDEEDDDDDDDDDVEDLALPSPREMRATSNAVRRITQDHAVDEEDEEDDGLVAELDAVFDQEDDGDSGTVGLGISGNGNQGVIQDEEESEVSEEE